MSSYFSSKKQFFLFF